MSIKCKYKDIKDIFEWCEKYADEEAKELIGTQPSTHIIAYFTPSQANWSYQVGIIKYKKNFYEVVLVFGEVRAVRLCNIPSYDNAKGVKKMKQGEKLYVVSMKHYGDDDFCGCCFEVVRAFTSLDDAKEFVKKDEEYSYDEVILDEDRGD